MRLIFGLIGAALLVWLHWSNPQIPIGSVMLVRDSVERVRVVEVAKHDTLIRWLRTAPADTLGAILRDRARRPPIVLRDTVILKDSVTQDTSCKITLTCWEARSLALQGPSGVLVIDSLRGDITIKDAMIDSLKEGCKPKSPWTAFGTGFGIGYAAGIGTCIAL